ncbi:electron transfer flavoprotein subunit alpha/FixB family protein [Thermoplasma sp. Kam2015]|uniref:electron transfer flavoprotein subunit alpha/FixB family protein n=1 Tax=Thermoplasma sp. Kam2015 TaxID=2094122 RepID=UPI000D979ED3|nr:electron transfer flavoprotein subunit alpha/FixB family protein [Thermoplasma sp. Kam2015]PYB68970.1 electron transfer flavoprotein subunit alpha/FixB family protein [Thermoplasma sp. Kam2015]
MKFLTLSDDINFLRQINTLISGKGEFDSILIGEGDPKGLGSGVLFRVKKDTPFDAISEGILKISKNYDYLVIGSTEIGREIAGYLSFKTGFYTATEIFYLDINGEKVHTKRFFFGGKTVIEEESDARIITVAPGVVEARDLGSTPQMKDLDVAQSRIRITKFTSKAGGSVRLEDAKVIVSVGRGIGSKENIAKVEPLAKALNGEIAGSRPVCMDYGWLSEDRQVGLSGKKVSPKVYIALGISGQIQHIAGMRNSKTVIAINKDKNAPIFQECDYGIVGDIFTVVPKILEQLKQ